MRGLRALETLPLTFVVTPTGAFGSVPISGSVLGYPVGSDFQLADYEQLVEYVRAIHAVSDLSEFDSITQPLKHF